MKKSIPSPASRILPFFPNVSVKIIEIFAHGSVISMDSFLPAVHKTATTCIYYMWLLSYTGEKQSVFSVYIYKLSS